jgi:hypothetical protein
MLGMINVYAGTNMKPGNHHQFLNDTFIIKFKNKFLRKKINISEVDTIEQADEKSCKSFLGSAVAGVLGMAALGPAGLLAGVLAGGNKQTKVFILKFKNGSSMLASTDSRTFLNMNSELFAYKLNEQLEQNESPINMKTIIVTSILFIITIMYTFFY